MPIIKNALIRQRELERIYISKQNANKQSNIYQVIKTFFLNCIFTKYVLNWLTFKNKPWGMKATVLTNISVPYIIFSIITKELDLLSICTNFLQ